MDDPILVLQGSESGNHPIKSHCFIDFSFADSDTMIEKIPDTSYIISTGYTLTANFQIFCLERNKVVCEGSITKGSKPRFIVFSILYDFSH